MSSSEEASPLCSHGKTLRETFDDQTKLFDSSITHDASWRIKQLNLLEKLMTDNREALQDALTKDLGKCALEGELTEINMCIAECQYHRSHLKEWMTPTQAASPGALAPAFSETRHEPRGVCAVIGPFNYPVNLTLGILPGVFSGGNTCILKPSNQCKAVSALIAKIVPQYFDHRVLAVLEGSVPQTNALMRETWGMVFFTGSERVGKIIAGAAAKTLTPVALELGGKSPLYISENMPDLTTMARRIMWGKTINSGQTCVAPDYIVCHTKNFDAVCEELPKALTYMFGDDPSKSDFSRMVTVSGAERIKSMIEEVEKKGCKILSGGSKKCDPENKYVAPTIVVNPPMDAKCMSEEIFGPILPIYCVDSEEEAVKFIKAQYGTPLAFYVYTSKNAEYQRMLRQIPSGGASRNDNLIHFATHLPFGGLGTSGYGQGHGYSSFKTFTHDRGSLDKPCHPAFEFGGIRYPPYEKYGGYSGKAFFILATKIPDLPAHSGKALMALGLFLLIETVVAMLGLGGTVRNSAADILLMIEQIVRP